jgi:hypothetical protein
MLFASLKTSAIHTAHVVCGKLVSARPAQDFYAKQTVDCVIVPWPSDTKLETYVPRRAYSIGQGAYHELIGHRFGDAPSIFAGEIAYPDFRPSMGARSLWRGC